ncbi:hydroxymethylbilane synthase [Formicincola oecophyllae]|uniref:Porphobilinogen deaminase n=1 Tax=Formicincola oecophyllae TaxID=2558361 RepID=A0A4Y6U970_9PROT|nr:hydroxymethylbilane synthase [Formicincola oecophyllae]QDH13922.1 hydroxymethylbilane synthase [Formicincola oecophyllae]
MNTSLPEDVQSFQISEALLHVAAEALLRGHGHGRARHSSLKLPLRVGTRASPLALVQTRAFVARLTRFCPRLRDMGAIKEVQMTTIADRNQVARLADIGGKGLFSREIHDVLLEGKIDLAVHSLKDLETELPPGIVLGCTLRREDARDALLLRDRSKAARAKAGSVGDLLACLPEGAMIGCSSVRRQAQLLHARPDLRFCLLRGNVQTRIDKLQAGACDATLLALAGLRRLDMADRADVILPPDVMVPASGQGIVGVTVRESDHELRELLAAVEDPESRAVATAERAFLAELDGSCRTPVGAYAVMERGRLHMESVLSTPDGRFERRAHAQSTLREAAALGRSLAARLRAETPPAQFAAITAP